jgi:cellulose synthase/poly-beta-1,6-N-acetylglucosamine synthase-like glycosyltransferase
VKRLPDWETLAGSIDPPPRGLCSVIIAARDEQARIEETIRHLLAQRGVDLEIIVVDDRSRDGTGEILRRLAQEDLRVRVKRVDALPAGWLGKCHACHVGASAARGEWILFTDADCWLREDVIARALMVAERTAADHVTLSAGTLLKGRGARAWYLLFVTSLLSWFSGTNRDRPRSYVGIGAFNLVRAAAYKQSGGYEALRLTVVDDMKLGLLLKRAGKRTRSFLGAQDVVCHWSDTVWGMVKIMEKNYFAALEFRAWLAVGGAFVTILVLAVLVLGVFSGNAAGLAAGLSPMLLIVPGAVLARRVGWGWTSAIWVPFMFPVFIFALLNSTWVTLRQGGVRWRDTFYDLEALRAGAVR